MTKTVSLGDVVSDYISRYGLTETARSFFLERVEEKDVSEGSQRAEEQEKLSPK
ncbi:hypothetical protein G0P98_25425 [Yangia sp. PrR004]|nr:hypothetical protein [Salipiger sp. PrR004]